MNDTFKIRAAGEEIGVFSTRQVMRMREREELENPVEFGSEKKSAWLPIAGLMDDEYPSSERIAQMKEAGIKSVKVLSGGDGDCPACAALTKSKYSIAKAPTIPPLGCSCIPWCRLCVVAAE